MANGAAATCQNPERNSDHHRKKQRKSRQFEMTQRPPRKFVRKRFTGGNWRCSAVVEIQACRSRIIFCVLGSRIESNHSGFVESSFKFAQRSDGRCRKRAPK